MAESFDSWKEGKTQNAYSRFYDEWWERVQPEMFKRGRIIIGNDADNPTTLCCSSWTDQYFTQKEEVVKGRRANGTYTVTTDRAGKYRFRLYRWPAETGTPLRSGLNVYFQDPGFYGEYLEGKALDICKAHMDINGKKQICEVHDGNLYSEFVFDLEAGEYSISLHYTPEGTWAGVCLTVLSVCVFGALVIRGYAKGRKMKHTKQKL